MARRERLIGDSAALLEGGEGLRFEVEIAGATEPAFAVRHEGVVRGFVNRCAHVPVELDWTPGRFFDDSGVYLICATHGALYSPENGYCVAGPCQGGRLKALELAEHDGKVFLIEHNDE